MCVSVFVCFEEKIVSNTNQKDIYHWATMGVPLLAFHRVLYITYLPLPLRPLFCSAIEEVVIT